MAQINFLKFFLNRVLYSVWLWHKKQPPLGDSLARLFYQFPDEEDTQDEYGVVLLIAQSIQFSDHIVLFAHIHA